MTRDGDPSQQNSANSGVPGADSAADESSRGAEPTPGEQHLSSANGAITAGGDPQGADAAQGASATIAGEPSAVAPGESAPNGEAPLTAVSTDSEGRWRLPVPQVPKIFSRMRQRTPEENHNNLAPETRAAVAAAVERAMTGALPVVPDDREPPVGTAASSHPPRWLPRALMAAVIAVFAGVFVWNALASLNGLLVNLLIAVFIALALEPPTLWLVRHGMKRGGAAAISLVGAVLAGLGIMALFGNLFVAQMTQLIQTLPSIYDEVVKWIEQRFNTVVPEQNSLVQTIWGRWGDDVTSSALSVGSALVGGLFAALTVLLVTYYLLAAGPRFRKAVCQFLRPSRQTEVLWLWEVAQAKVSGFLSSRVVLALASSAATFVFLMILKTPYSLPLALVTGVISQFVPTIGTYIGGALPVLVALTAQGTSRAIIVVIFIVAYQQVENLWLAPRISARALEMNPAVSFIVVIGFGSVFGALGAFLALPVAAVIQAVGATYLQRHDLVESALLHDPGEDWQDTDAAGKAAEESVEARKNRDDD